MVTALKSDTVVAWSDICLRYPDEWVCLFDVEQAPDGAILAGRLVAHDRSAIALLDELENVCTGGVIASTSGRRLGP